MNPEHHCRRYQFHRNYNPDSGQWLYRRSHAVVQHGDPGGDSCAQCTFSPVPVSITTSGGAPTATITIITAGTNTTAQLRSPRIFDALWMLVPGLALAGLGSAESRRRKLLGFLVLTMLAAGILLIPACGSSTNAITIPGTTGVTPKNAYTFTVTGADENGLTPSNTAPTVTVTVN